MAHLPPPTPGPPAPDIPGGRARRTLLLFSIGAVVLVVGFLAFAGAEAIYLIRNGKAQVSDTLPSNLPKEIPICTGFSPAHTFVVDLGHGKRYEVQGDCPENRLQLVDDFINQMASGAWTVHDDGAGNLSGYDYEHHERIDIALVDSNNASNQTTVTIQMETGVDQVPSDFPQPSPSPSNR
jgi:hypothetical protein